MEPLAFGAPSVPRTPSFLNPQTHLICFMMVHDWFMYMTKLIPTVFPWVFALEH